ncbi:MAG: hypothetical protein AAF628_20510 [Planctomycetota bacterium]
MLRACHARFALFLTTSAATALAQTTWIVDESGGPGAQFTELPPAVSAAAPGDVILIRSGTYDAPSQLSKGLTLSAESRADVVVIRSALWTIEDLPAGQHCVLKSMAGGPAGLHVQCRDADGWVHLEDIRNLSMGIERCPQVTLHSCDGTTVDVSGSQVLIDQCTFVAPDLLLFGTSSVSAVDSSRLVIHGSTITGGGCSAPMCHPGPAVFYDESDVLAIHSLLFAGYGYYYYSSPVIVGSGTFTRVGRSSFFYSPVPLSEIASLTAQFAPGAISADILSAPDVAVALLASVPRRDGPLWFGPRLGWPGLWVDETDFVVLHQGTRPPGGAESTLSLSFPLPQGYHAPLALQAVLLNHGLRFSNGSVLVLGPET